MASYGCPFSCIAGNFSFSTYFGSRRTSAGRVLRVRATSRVFTISATSNMEGSRLAILVRLHVSSHYLHKDQTQRRSRSLSSQFRSTKLATATRYSCFLFCLLPIPRARHLHFAQNKSYRIYILDIQAEGCRTRRTYTHTHIMVHAHAVMLWLYSSY